jgi:solute carrier family 25 (adenine nucleotide translocator) protein 4/5/6/31
MGKDKSQREFKGMWDCLKKTYIREGVRGLYRGFIIGAASIFFYRGLYFGIYDTGKELLLKDCTIVFDLDDPLWLRILWAQATVIFSETLSYPGDTIKRKMMMQSLKAEKMYSGSLDCIRQTYMTSFRS